MHGNTKVSYYALQENPGIQIVKLFPASKASADAKIKSSSDTGEWYLFILLVIPYQLFTMDPISDMTKGSAKPLAAYSSGHIVKLSPDLALLYISGTTARQADGQIPPFGHSFYENKERITNEGPKPSAIQTRIILDKISSVISATSGRPVGLECLVELTIFVKDLKNDYEAVNKVYNEMVGHKFRELGIPLPARTCVEVSGMPPDGRTLVEMKGVAKIQTQQQ